MSKYTDLITNYHATKPKFVEHIDLVTRPLAETSAAINGLINAFDIDNAAGVQLDILGQWIGLSRVGFAPIFPDTCHHLTHYWPAAVDIPVASDNPVHYADAIRYNARTPLQGSLLPLTRLVWA